ncbi:hypothetical protein GZH49_01175 [Nocardia terpenica]|uniref:hypothetical protein n=1 Tax=Nocardia terpenica TaxID=455432 RepID=UPI002FE2E5A7
MPVDNPLSRLTGWARTWIESHSIVPVDEVEPGPWSWVNPSWLSAVLGTTPL